MCFFIVSLDCRASHGTKFISDDELYNMYGSKKHWKHFEELIANVDNIGTSMLHVCFGSCKFLFSYDIELTKSLNCNAADNWFSYVLCEFVVQSVFAEKF
jgi:hypothetical protein